MPVNGNQHSDGANGEQKQNICILCTGNSCRSVMAERLLRKHHSDIYNVYSAGSKPAKKVNEGAVEVLHELGIDATDHQPHTLTYWNEQGVTFDYIITVCDDANESWYVNSTLYFSLRSLLFSHFHPLPIPCRSSDLIEQTN